MGEIQVNDSVRFTSHESSNDHIYVVRKTGAVTSHTGNMAFGEKKLVIFRPHQADRPDIAKEFLGTPPVTRAPLDAPERLAIATLDNASPEVLHMIAYEALQRLTAPPVDRLDGIALGLFAIHHGYTAKTSVGSLRWPTWHHVPTTLLGKRSVTEAAAIWRKMAEGADQLLS